MRKNISSGAPWEDQVGYCRAVKIGNTIEVSGTAPVRNGETTIEDVVRTRIFVTDISQWVAVGKAHGEVFGNIKPATTMVEVSALIDPKMLVEIEASAILS